MRRTVLMIGLLTVAHALLARGDGLDEWTRVTNLTDTISTVQYLNQGIVAVGQKGVYASLDGSEWSQLPPIPRGITKSVAFGGGRYVAAGGTLSATSLDLTNWTVRAVGGARDLQSVAYGESGFLLLDLPGTLWTALDGADWRATGATITNNTLTYAGGRFLGTGLKTASSADGTKWDLASTNTVGAGDLSLRAAAYGTAGWTGIGTNAGAVWMSPDAVRWTRSALLQATNLVRLTFAGGRYVAVGDRGLVWTSPDGRNWTGRFLPDEGVPRFIAHNGSHFVALTEDGAVYRSGLVAAEAAPATIAPGLYLGLRIQGTVGSRYDIEVTPDATGAAGWTRVGSIVLPASAAVWMDVAEATFPQQFYRAVEVR